ncbi:kinase-like domain-containing protein [Colletotrichum cereale]|nr:kinase-like domain-containing protein [Colletotrichum cereale]
MEVLEKAEAYVEKDGDFFFDFTKFILRKDDQLYYARVHQKLPGALENLDTLHAKPIPTEHIWPLFSANTTRVLEPLPSNCFIKQPSLLDYGDHEAALHIDEQVMEEVTVCELLKNNPHPNIATYLGCIEKAGRIGGICFVKYPINLQQLMDAKLPMDPKTIIEGIESGIQHIHRLGLIHNDINPSNVMITSEGNPVIIDFESCRHKGEELGPKAGTYGWELAEAKHALPANDFYGLSKIKELLS